MSASTSTKFLSLEDGAKVIGVIERDGALTSDEGLDVVAVKDWIKTTGGVQGFPGATFVANGGSVLESDCDILIPAALEGVIHAQNAAQIKAKLIIEAANGPITAAADEVLRTRGVVVIPDLYANAGGVTVSYFEWVKKLVAYSFWSNGAPCTRGYSGAHADRNGAFKCFRRFR